MDGLICKICNNEYSGRPNTRYCSDRCSLDYARVKQNEYRSTRPERNKEDLARLMRWKENNPEKNMRARKVLKAKRKHEQRSTNNPATLTSKEWSETLEFFDNSCAYCGIVLEEGYHKDHFIPLCMGGEYTAANIIPSCPSCNMRKNAMHPRDVCDEDTWNYITGFLEKNALAD